MDYREKLSKLSKIIDNPIESFQRFVDLSRAYEEKMIIRGHIYREWLSKLSEIVDHPIDSFQGLVKSSRKYEENVEDRYHLYRKQRISARLKQESSLEHISRKDINFYRETADIVRGVPSFVLWLAKFSYCLAFTNKPKEWVDNLNKNASKAM